MNQDSDKEMGLLLQRHARRSASGLSGRDEASAKPMAPHMDADELSAYAEGALPVAARSRYALHLADCDSCRKIVTQLVLSSSVESQSSGTVTQTVEAPARSWSQWFAALFSPPVLRFAAPVLALVAFASIVFVVITRNREVPSFISQNDSDRQAPAREAKEQNDEPARSGDATSVGANANQGAPASANTSVGTAPNSAAPASRLPGDAGPTPSSTEADDIRGADSPKTADETASAPPPPPMQERGAEVKQSSQTAPNNSPSDKLAERAKEKDDATLAAQKPRERGEVSMDGAQSVAGAGAGRRSPGTESAKRGALGATRTDNSTEERQQKNEVVKSAPAPAARARRDAGGDNEDSTPTRTVAGKRFRQQNGIWVDTSYNSSRSPLRVKRGSEQYRALVADEPVIGAVSNSLGGDVIVVVSGRAYHIY
jgi:hypothetical protein